MKSAVLSRPQPILVTEKKVWLEVCGWKVPAGFASPAGDHTRKRIDLNDHLIRNADATYVHRVPWWQGRIFENCNRHVWPKRPVPQKLKFHHEPFDGERYMNAVRVCWRSTTAS